MIDNVQIISETLLREKSGTALITTTDWQVILPRKLTYKNHAGYGKYLILIHHFSFVKKVTSLY